MIGELITAGAGLLGSIFGKKKKEKTETTIDYVKMAEKAQEAGFNPLTALRNGGSAGFTSTVHHPGLSGVGDAIANLGGTLGAALSKRMDPIEQKRDRVESALLDYQLNTIQSGPKKPMMFGDVPTRTGRNIVATPKAALSSGAKKAPGVSSRLLSSQSTAGYFEPPKAADADLPIWVSGKDRDGKRVWIPNPDGPDIEQALYAWSTRPIAGAEAYAGTIGEIISDPKTAIRSRKATVAEKKKAEESWHGGWLPSLGVTW
jgi:hypothetical protein